MALRGYRIVSSRQHRRVVVIDRSSQNADLWDLGRRAKLASFGALVQGLEAVSFSLDGSLVAAASRGGSVQVWDASSGARLGTFRVPNVRALAFSADNRRLVTGGDDGRLSVIDINVRALLDEACGLIRHLPEFESMRTYCSAI